MNRLLALRQADNQAVPMPPFNLPAPIPQGVLGLLNRQRQAQFQEPVEEKHEEPVVRLPIRRRLFQAPPEEEEEKHDGQQGNGVPSNPHIPTYAYIDYLVPSNQPFNTLALRPSINIAN